MFFPSSKILSTEPNTADTERTSQGEKDNQSHIEAKASTFSVSQSMRYGLDQGGRFVVGTISTPFWILGRILNFVIRNLLALVTFVFTAPVVLVEGTIFLAQMIAKSFYALRERLFQSSVVKSQYVSTADITQSSDNPHVEQVIVDLPQPILSDNKDKKDDKLEEEVNLGLDAPIADDLSDDEEDSDEVLAALAGIVRENADSAVDVEQVVSDREEEQRDELETEVKTVQDTVDLELAVLLVEENQEEVLDDVLAAENRDTTVHVRLVASDDREEEQRDELETEVKLVQDNVDPQLAVLSGEENQEDVLDTVPSVLLSRPSIPLANKGSYPLTLEGAIQTLIRIENSEFRRLAQEVCEKTASIQVHFDKLKEELESYIASSSNTSLELELQSALENQENILDAIQAIMEGRKMPDVSTKNRK